MNNAKKIISLTKPYYPENWTEIDTCAVNTIRMLAVDAVQKIGSGHPGTAMSLAPLAYVLFQRQMRHNPSDTNWIGRDRFVLSCGHSSLTLYLQLYLGGFGLELSNITKYRTWRSLTPGHPEYKCTKGVEITTGLLGQGLASAIGMAMASRYERGLFDPESNIGSSLFDHYIYVIASDGDMEEGITSEASSLAGVQQLGNLIVIWDNNKISIDDDTTITLSENVTARYIAYGWHVQEVQGSENVLGIEKAIEYAKKVVDKPSLIAFRTIIGYPAPTKMNTSSIHGTALGIAEVAATKIMLGFNPSKSFEVNKNVINYTRKLINRGKQAHEDWGVLFNSWVKREPKRKLLLDRLQSKKLPEGWDNDLPFWKTNSSKLVATRTASGNVLNAIGQYMPELWGGSADLSVSNNTAIKEVDSFGPPSISNKEWKATWYGRILHFGVREHAMAAILSGIILHGPTRPYGGTFLQFSDYMRPAIRLASLMNIDPIYIWTHDSVALGEDGPTHQPVEHLSTLRAIPNLCVVRPGDSNETVYAWKTILERKINTGPVGLVLTRQEIPILEGTNPEGVAQGGYVLGGTMKEYPDVLIIATGSELHLAVSAQKLLLKNNINATVVSMPCIEWFESQSKKYRESVLPPAVSARVVIEAAIAQCWHKLAGKTGETISIENYGQSGDGNTLLNEFGFTPEAISAAAKRSIRRSLEENLTK